MEDSELDNLSRTLQARRSNEAKRAIGRKNGATIGPADTQVAPLEQRLAEEMGKRDTLATALAAQEAGRNAAIEKAIEDSPNAVRKRAGLAAKIEAMSALANGNLELLAVILAVEFLSLCLELGPLWAASMKLPSSLAAALRLITTSKRRR
ncbi:hypothetical protein SSBR45G_19460 [Bradyrhizobium sp. SSBR45G]|nr:hypothetical protein SSBR45G_19460 [Bradyrhizobium sp. SSBR45G]GLH83796.1 hypothetical protein SSBR45R_12560 [Bradyrhizobium sp. SSBR45R]